MQSKIIKSKNNNNLKMEDDLNYFLKKEDNLNWLKMDDNLKKIMQPKTFKNQNNDCGTASGNLVLYIITI